MNAASAGRRARGRSVRIALGLTAFVVTAAALAAFVRDRRRSTAFALGVRQTLAARRLDDAQALIDRWKADRPDDAEADYWRAVLLVKRDRPAEAIEACRDARARRYPERPLDVLSAILQARAGQFAAAEPILRRARAEGAEPRGEIAEGLARIDLGSFRLDSAAAEIAAWMKADPADPRPYLWRNEIDGRTGAEADVLIRNDRAALARDPTLLRARVDLADRLRKSHRMDEAAAEYAILLASDPKSLDGRLGAGHVALERGDMAAATGHFAAALKIDPANVVALRQLALLDLRDGRPAEARDRLQAAVKAAPDDFEVRETFVRVLKINGDLDRARAETRVADRLRNDAETIDSLRSALVERPNDADLRLKAARWLIGHGHEKEGLDWTGLILKGRPGHPETCRFLADYYQKKGNVGLANYYRAEIAP